MAYEAGKPVGPPGPEAVQASDYEAYQFIVQTVSDAITKGVKESLSTLQEPENFQEMVQETFQNSPEAAPNPESIKDLWQGFWNLATGLDCDVRWRSLSGVPERSYSNVAEIKPNLQELGSDAEHPEFSIGVSAFGFGVGVSW